MPNIDFSQAVEGFLLSLGARHLSHNTISDYSRTLARFAKQFGHLPVASITTAHVESYLAGLTGLSNKSILNQYIALSSMWTWLVADNLAPAHILKKIKPPKPETKDILPLTEEEIRLIVNALGRSKIYKRQGKSVDHSLGSADRNRAIILLMLDTGARVSEICNLNIQDVDQRNNRITLKNRKGSKTSALPFSPRTGQAIWKYLTSRKDSRPEDPLFLSRLGSSLNRHKLNELFHVIGQRAGVPRLHPHLLRHTFAIFYLRNGGDPYTLQEILDHSTMEMVRRYLRIAQVDLDRVHRRASPVDNLRL